MSDPYRSADGISCLRCEMGLIADDTGDLVCSAGCGRWISATALTALVGEHPLARLGRPVAHWKATPFADAACPRCKASLEPLYMPLPDGGILTHGACTRHGCWLDHGTRHDFEAAYRADIAAATAARELAQLPGTEFRFETIEDRVARLERQVAELRQYVGRRRWADWKE